jgi:hypothetical protein
VHSLLDQHDGNIVFDRIHEVTSITDEPVVGLIEMDIPLALGARQDIQEILADCHTLTSSLSAETV